MKEHYTDAGRYDVYSRKMWEFIDVAAGRVDQIINDLNLAETTFGKVLKYYGEDDKNMSSSEFYGIFKTFLTSYKGRFVG